MRHRASNEDFLFLQLKDENSKLRRKLTEVQSFSETQTEMYVSFELGLQFKLSSLKETNAKTIMKYQSWTVPGFLLFVFVFCFKISLLI